MTSSKIHQLTISRRDSVKILALTSVLASSAVAPAHAFTLRGAIGGLYYSSSQMRAELGAPTSEEIPLGDGGCYQQFVGGRAYWHPSTGATWFRYGGIYNYYHNAGGTKTFGYPTTNVYANGRGANGWSLETHKPSNGARYSIEWENSVGAVPVYLNGAIGHLWKGQPHVLGFPLVAEESLSAHAAYQRFSNGISLWNTSSGVSFHTHGRYERTGVRNYLRRTDLSLGASDVLILADSQANYGSPVIGGTESRNDPSWISKGLRAAGWRPIHYSYGGIGAVAGNGYLPSYNRGVLANGFTLPLGEPGLIFICGSGNDLWVGLSYQQVAAEYVKLIQELRVLYPHSRIVVSEVISRRIAEHRNRHALADAIGNATSAAGATVVPSRYWVTDTGASHLLLDSVHLSDQGHAVVGQHFGSWLRSAGVVPHNGYRLFGAIGHYYHANGGAARFGLPTQNEFGSTDGGAVQNFAGGWAIYWSEQTGAHAIRWGTDIAWRYTHSRWELGELGYPATDEYAYSYGAAQEFFKPSTGLRTIALWSEGTGTHLSNRNGGIYHKWVALGGGDRLGFPVTDETGVSGGACQYYQDRAGQKNAIYWSEKTGAKHLYAHGAIYWHWRNNGFIQKFGFPTTDEHLASDGFYKVFFSAGYVISWSGRTGVRVSRA